MKFEITKGQRDWIGQWLESDPHACKDMLYGLKELKEPREASRELQVEAELWRWVSPRLECRKEAAVSGEFREALTVRLGRAFVDTKPRATARDAEILEHLITVIKEANHE